MLELFNFFEILDNKHIRQELKDIKEEGKEREDLEDPIKGPICPLIDFKIPKLGQYVTP